MQQASFVQSGKILRGKLTVPNTKWQPWRRPAARTHLCRSGSHDALCKANFVINSTADFMAKCQTLAYTQSIPYVLEQANWKSTRDTNHAPAHSPQFYHHQR